MNSWFSFNNDTCASGEVSIIINLTLWGDIMIEKVPCFGSHVIFIFISHSV